MPLLTCTYTADTQALKVMSGSVYVVSPAAHKFLFEPSEHLWQVWGLILNEILPLLPSFGGFSLPLDWGIIFFAFGLGYQCGVQHSPVDGCSAANCDFEVLT